jgi:hypothetical protein
MENPLDIVRNALNLATKALDAMAVASPGDAIVSASDRPLGMTPSTFRDWCKSGRIKGATLGPRRRYQARLSAVRAALEANPVQPRVREVDGSEDALDAAIGAGAVRR